MVGLSSRVENNGRDSIESRRVCTDFGVEADIERPLLVTHLGPVSPLWTLSRRWSSVRLQRTERQHLVRAKTQTQVRLVNPEEATQSVNLLSLADQQRCEHELILFNGSFL